MNKILIPTDFSSISENAVNYALDLANTFEANIILLYVNQLPITTPEFGLGGYSVLDIKEESLNLMQKIADDIKRTHPLIKSVECCIEMGNATNTILEYSNKHNINLVIMGNSGHGSALKKSLFGSTSVSVSKKTKVPLIIVPPNVTFSKVKQLAFANDYDVNIEDNSTLIKIKYLNTFFNSILNILHVIPEKHLINKNESIIDNFVEDSMATTKHKTFIITDNNVCEGLLDFIDNHDIDMIIIESKEHSFFHSIFYPSVTNNLAFLSPIPVLIVHG